MSGRARLLLPLVFLTLLAAPLAPGPAAAQQSSDADTAERDRPRAGTTAGVEGPRIRVTPPAGAPRHEARAPRIRAVRLEGEIELDGRLDEAVWDRAPAARRFAQREPDEGEPATQPTEVRFTYDGETLYVGARMYDEEGGDGVVSRLVRRDEVPDSDRLVLTFDTHLDHLGQTMFGVNPAGVRADALAPGGSGLDDSWDPVWRAATSVDAEGWTAELAIPFSQLRFPEGREQRWGLQIERIVQRRAEHQMWSFWRRNQQGGPSRYGHLEGIEAPETGTDRLELLPYTVTQLDVSPGASADNPFETSTDATTRLGEDVTYLLSSNLTLNATINPDFGQVEVDPAVVNLSAFETFFPEKREFFIADRGLFDFGSFWCFFCSNTSNLSLLHTRRIGRPPQAAGLAEEAGEFADVPGNTTILGAAKVTGRTAGGTSLGVMAAATGKETADVVTEDRRRIGQEVEPFTGYFVSRVKRDFLDGDLSVGGMVTSVYRNFDDPALADRLSEHHEGVGLDAEYWWGERTYHLLFSAAFSNVSGTPEAIHDLQRSSARYFQRPDRQGGGNGLFSDALDPSTTSLRGWGLYSRVAKDAGDWRAEAAVNARSPGFETNDIGFLTRTDFLWMSANVQRLWTTPTSWYREIGTIVGGQQELNFDGDLVGRQLHSFFFVELPNYWEINAFGIWRPSTLDDRLSRGGVVLRRPERGFLQARLGTDDRKPVVLSLTPTAGWNAEGARDWSVGLGLELRPASNVSVELTPRLSRTESTDQFVTTVEDPTATDFFGRRHVFADLTQRSLSMETRLNWTFTPDLSLELFVQPFISANDFGAFKQFAAPRELAKQVFGRDVGTIRSEGEGFDQVFHVDPDGPGPAGEFSFEQRNFTFASLRGNAVLRWEYLPGSTLFFVWTQDRSAREAAGDLRFGRDAGNLFTAEGENVFLVKATYWLGL
jgi:hypothetical protein